MASPQKENGYIPVANEIAEAFMKLNLSPQEYRVLWVILRKTYGFNKKDDCISLSQFSQMTGIDRRHVHRALKKLSSKQVIAVTQTGDRMPPRYCFQKDFDKWCLSPKQATVVPKQVTKLSPKQAPTKDNTKDKRHKGVPFNKILDLYHENLPVLPRVKILSEKRKRQLKARWFQTDKTCSLQWWEDFFKYIQDCPFLLGENNRQWRADLEWITRQENFAKIIEGKYQK